MSPSAVAALLDARGGNEVVARGIGVSRAAVRHWRKKSVIPLGRRPAVLALPLQARSKTRWTTAETATLRLLWKRGICAREIAAALPDRTQGMVRSKAFDMRLPAPAVRQPLPSRRTRRSQIEPGPPPDAEMRAVVLAMWGAGCSVDEIAVRTGRNRNQVIGVAHRMGLLARPSPIRRNP